MIENKLHFFFKNQIWHIGGLIVLYYVALQLVDFEADSNVFLGIGAKNISYHRGSQYYDPSAFRIN